MTASCGALVNCRLLVSFAAVLVLFAAVGTDDDDNPQAFHGHAFHIAHKAHKRGRAERRRRPVGEGGCGHRKYLSEALELNWWMIRTCQKVLFLRFGEVSQNVALCGGGREKATRRNGVLKNRGFDCCELCQ